jgi:hypothetical protein
MISQFDAVQSECPTGEEAAIALTREVVSIFLASFEGQIHLISEVWCQHIANVRLQIETAIVALTREFSDIVFSLDSLIATADRLEADEQRLAESLDRSQLDERFDIVATLRQTAVNLEQEANRIRANINAALLHLQFQDRVNQILGHVESNIHALPESLIEHRLGFAHSGQLLPADLSHLLDELKSSYTTLEERNAHPESGKPGSDQEIHYF